MRNLPVSSAGGIFTLVRSFFEIIISLVSARSASHFQKASYFPKGRFLKSSFDDPESLKIIAENNRKKAAEKNH